MKILGIETSCDETSVAIVTDNREILAQKILSQIDIHKEFGGVVPEVAARAHINYLPTIINNILIENNLVINDIDIIAVTSGPGLIGGLLVGLMVAKGIAYTANKALIAVNHLEGHALTVRLTNDIEFPYLLLLVSGGHCQILIVRGVGEYEKLGSTLDDALGEAFDKVAKLLGLDYPGGPIIEQLAKKGDENAFALPKSMVGREGCDFSFSGIKTFVRNLVIEKGTLNEEFVNNLCASFQKTCADIIIDRVSNAIKIYEQKGLKVKNMVIAGGVAANMYIRNRVEEFLNTKGYSLAVPPIKLCTDNAAMIAWAGYERFKQGFINSLDIEPMACWSLEKLQIKN